MHPFIRKLVIRTTLPKDKKTAKEDLSPFVFAKSFKDFKLTIRRFFRDIILMSLGVIIAAFGLESFLIPSKFIDGGVTGTSLLISELSTFPLSVLLVLINIPFIIVGYHVISKQFAIKTACAIAALAIVVATFHFPEITHDKLLVAVFGGFFLGVGVGLSMRGGAVLDGTEVLAVYLSRKFSLSVGDIIIAINTIVFSVAAYTLSVESALYSMITYLAVSRTINFIIDGIEEYTGVTIISYHSERIRMMIVEKMGRGVTVYTGKSGFGKRGHSKEMDIVYTVITRLELNKLKNEIDKIDPNAFVVMNSIRDTKGGMIKKRPLHHSN